MSVTRRWSCAHAIPTSSTKAIASAALAVVCRMINEFIVIVVIPRKHPSRPDRSRRYLEISPPEEGISSVKSGQATVSKAKTLIDCILEEQRMCRARSEKTNAVSSATLKVYAVARKEQKTV